ncbi:hypothetical protein [Kitasatospora aureofaciens]|uniref:hypothetical protein n=1 Tax=Kitasatospora aureofaciens TaxID=1894 RepID=UPI001F429B60|nr:hypothetical protein [Kitasatospora aureofaciens]
MMTEEPVLLTDWPASTAKLSAVPRGTAVAMACARTGVKATPAAAINTIPAIQAEILRQCGTAEKFSVT